MKILLVVAVLAIAGWFVFTHIRQVDVAQKAAVNYAQNLKNDAQSARAAAQQIKAQTQALKKSLDEAKAAQ